MKLSVLSGAAACATGLETAQRANQVQQAIVFQPALLSGGKPGALWARVASAQSAGSSLFTGDG